MIFRSLRTSAISLACTAISFFSGLPQTGAAEPFHGILIQLEDGKQLSVTGIMDPGPITLGPKNQALIVWSDGGREAWQHIAPGDTWSPPRHGHDRPDAMQLIASTRGQGQGGTSPAGVGRFTTQIVQLLGVTVFRGKSFVTPHNGPLLNPRITIRRRSKTKDDTQALAAVAVLKRGNTEIARIPFAENQEKVAFDQIPGLAEKYPEGLEPGEYTLRMEGGGESAVFTVEEREWSAYVMEPANNIAGLLNRADPLFLQVAVETVLDQRDENDNPLAYLSDALDLLESVPADQLTIHLQSVKSDILRRLNGEKPRPANSSLLMTGIPAIDRVRLSIATGAWRAAQDELDRVPNEPRAQALAKLHRAEIMAQSGLGLTDAARVLFEDAIRELKDGSELDRFLAYNNFGNFCLTQAQDRLYNHAFQIAAGVTHPLLTALDFWRAADSSYNAALQLGDHMDADQRAGVEVNAARLQVLLGDIIQTLDSTQDGRRRFQDGETAARRSAAGRVASITDSANANLDPLIRATAHEIQAQLAFRSRQADECQSHADEALANYLDAGSLAGAEGIYRLLGLLNGHQAEFTPNGKATPESGKLALRHFQVSMELAELLRARIPADQIGLSQAGFFARRTYVNEQVIDLFVKQGKSSDALHYAERAKARSLDDLLATRNIVGNEDEEASSSSLDEILESWPEDVTAIEYFLGTERGWVFVVDPAGDVTARELAREDGTPLSPRELLADVQTLLNGINGSAGKMRYGADWGEWQKPLHRFYRQLIPQVAISAARKAKTVVIVPHHILHYLPFSALVVKPDAQERSRMEVPLARFLVDEPFDTCTAPSLVIWAALRNRHQPAIREVNAVGVIEVPGHDPLPGVATDLQNLRSVFGDRIQQVVEGAEADEPHVKSLLSRSGLLFVATHGHNIAQQPLASFLLCQSSKDNEGKLTAAEIFNTDVGASMVVMSACYSGLADQSPLPGDDLFGLQRAFLQAGARTVVAGLWDVYDGTGPLLMHDFFKHLASGHAAASALAESQRTFLAQQRAEGPGNPWLHPYFWAVYSATGDDRTSLTDD